MLTNKLELNFIFRLRVNVRVGVRVRLRGLGNMHLVHLRQVFRRIDPSAAENSSHRRKFYGCRKSAAKYCGWSQSAVNLLFGGRQIFFSQIRQRFCSTLQFLQICKWACFKALSSSLDWTMLFLTYRYWKFEIASRLRRLELSYLRVTTINWCTGTLSTFRWKYVSILCWLVSLVIET